MRINVLAFGISKDILGSAVIHPELEEGSTIEDLKNLLETQYPDFQRLRKFDIAANQEYRSNQYIIRENDEIAIIPPVSGG